MSTTSQKHEVKVKIPEFKLIYIHDLFILLKWVRRKRRDIFLSRVHVLCNFLYPFQFVDILEEAEESEEDTINEMID